MYHYLLGALPARLGDEMSGQTLLLLGIALTGSAGFGATLLAALTLSAAVGGSLLGALLDRSDQPGKMLAGMLAFYATGIGVIAILANTSPLWLLLVIALLAGFLMPAISGGWSSQLPIFVSKEQMTRASALDASSFNLAGLIGPALAGIISAQAGAHWSVVALITLLLAAVPMAWRLPNRVSSKKARTSISHDISVGFVAIIKNRALLRITLVSVISYAGIGMLWVLYPLIGERLFGNVGWGGVLATAVSAAALVATAAYAKWPTKWTPDTVAFGTTLILAVGILLLLVLDNVAVVLAALAIIGLADGPQLAAVFAVRHREAPEALRSQVFTTAASLKITAAAVGAAGAGWLVEAFTLEATIIAACAAQLVGAIFYCMFRNG